MKSVQQLLSENLKAIRKEKKLSQQDVAERSDMIASTYNRIENNKVSPSLDTVERIALALKIPFVKLFQLRDVKEMNVSEKMKMIDNMSEYNQNVVSILLDSIIEKDKLEKKQQVKMEKRLEDLERARKK